MARGRKEEKRVSTERTPIEQRTRTVLVEMGLHWLMILPGIVVSLAVWWSSARYVYVVVEVAFPAVCQRV